MVLKMLGELIVSKWYGFLDSSEHTVADDRALLVAMNTNTIVRRPLSAVEFYNRVAMSLVDSIGLFLIKPITGQPRLNPSTQNPAKNCCAAALEFFGGSVCAVHALPHEIITRPSAC